MSNDLAIVPSVGTEQTNVTTDAGSRPSGQVAGSIFDRLQKTIPAEAPKKPEEKAKEAPKAGESTALARPEDTVAQALADAGKAPATAPEPAALATPAKKDSASVRALVKSSNIPADFKDEVSNLAYMGRALQEAGMTLDAVRLYKEQGITPAVIAERLKLHPTIDDARRDTAFAAEIRRLGSDYNTNPKEFLSTLKKSSVHNPDVYTNVIVEAASQLKDVAHSKYVADMTDALRTALYNLGQEMVKSGDEEKQTAVKMVQAEFGFSDAPVARRTENPEITKLKKQNAELLAKQSTVTEESRNAFLASVVSKARDEVFTEIAKRWNEAAPAGLDETETKRALEDVFYAVEKDLNGVQNFVYDMQLKRNGPQTEQAYREAVKYAFDRALPFIPTHQKSALDFWTKRALAAAQVTETKTQKAAHQVDAADVSGQAPGVPAETNAERIKKLKSEGNFDFKDLIRATMSGRK